MKSTPSPSSVRQLPKSAPNLTPTKKTAEPLQSHPKTGKLTKLQRQQRLQELMPQAEKMSQQNPGLHPHNAFEVLLGQYTLEEWKARRQATVEKKKAYFQMRKQAQEVDYRSQEEKDWCTRFFDGPEPEPIWLEATIGDYLVRITRVQVFALTVQMPDGRYKGLKKTRISALCSAADSPQVIRMRTVQPEAQRDAVPAYRPKDRWAFPEELFISWRGQQVQVQLLNGTTWTGFLRWNSRHTFLLGARPAGEPEVLIFKHACCGVQLIPVGQ